MQRMNDSKEKIASVPCEQNCLCPGSGTTCLCFLRVCHACVMTMAWFSCCFHRSIGPSQGCCCLSNPIGTVIYHYVMGDGALHRFGARRYNAFQRIRLILLQPCTTVGPSERCGAPWTFTAHQQCFMRRPCK